MKLTLLVSLLVAISHFWLFSGAEADLLPGFLKEQDESGSEKYEGEDEKEETNDGLREESEEDNSNTSNRGVKRKDNDIDTPEHREDCNKHIRQV
jgi:hypothetical protein